MEAILKTSLSKAQADALFAEECILIGSRDVISEFRMVELFGEWLASWAEEHSEHEGLLQGGQDYNSYCSVFGSEAHEIRYFTITGFYKAVTHHNIVNHIHDHQQSPAGQIIDEVWKARAARRAAADAEEERRMNEAKAKRAAARAARKAAKEAQQAKEKPADRAESQQA